MWKGREDSDFFFLFFSVCGLERRREEGPQTRCVRVEAKLDCKENPFQLRGSRVSTQKVLDDDFSEMSSSGRNRERQGIYASGLGV